MKKTLTLLLAIGGALSLQPALAADDGEALFKSKPCSACHAVETKLVGPAFKDVAAKYSGQPDAQAKLVKSITEGSQGKWGAMPMPPNVVTMEEANTLAAWVLSQK